MLANVVSELGPWSWMVFGFVLLIFEVFAPGVFLLWIGIAAIIVGALSLALWEAAFWTWPLQTALFAVLSVVCLLIGKRIYDGRVKPSDQPLINQRGSQAIGRTATLTEPIRDGRGRIQLGDTLWRVSGPDLPVGTQVRVVSTNTTDLELIVEPVAAS